MFIRFALFAMVTFASQVLWAQAIFPGIRRGFEGTRANGMGGAFVAVASDNTAIFYNPAGLGQLEKGESNWFIKNDLDPEILDFWDEIDTATGAANEEDAIREVIQSNYTNH